MPQTIIRRLEQVLRVGFGGKTLTGKDLDYSRIVVNAKVLIGGTG
jgi:hypothetical protein